MLSVAEQIAPVESKLKPLNPVHFLVRPGTTADDAASRLNAHVKEIRSLLLRLEKLVVPAHLETVTSLLRELDDYNVRVSLVGQVKAGKTMLTNALVGMPGMLPSDVNPWTSVVTSVHVNTPKPGNNNAVFTFYNREEWEGLIHGGGRLGELAKRADFEAELADMRQQVTEMQRRTEERLGANFELLLGERHSFSGFNTKIIERYVCLGDPEQQERASGRYADLTKAADLYIDDSSFGFPLTISDTPGVNDPFLARERATVESLSRSDVCVIVLSAHQAFTTVDVSLLRILRTLKAEQVVFFVNRIDELSDPDNQIAEIDRFIRGILRDQNLNANLPIVYGSAAWAEYMLLGPATFHPCASMASLEALVNSRVARSAQPGESARPGHPPYSTGKTQDLSGLQELKTLISRLAVRNVAAPDTAGLLLHAADVARQSTLLVERALEGDLPWRAGFNIDAVIDQLDTILHRLDDECRLASRVISDKMLLTMSNAFREFIDSESVKLRWLIASGGRIADWSPDADSLRVALNAAYHLFAAESCEKVAAIYAGAAELINSVYSSVLPEKSRLFSVRAPQVARPKAPAALMRTMSFDMRTTWIDNWLARATGPSLLASRFAETVTAEMRDFLAEMADVHVLDFVEQSRKILHDFLLDHIKTLQSLAALDGSGRNDVLQQKLGIELTIKQRLVALKGLHSELEARAETLCADFDLVVE